MKARLLILLAAVAALLALAVAGCGGGGSSEADPASVAPASSPLYVEVAVRPEGELKSNVEALASSVAGIDDLGGLIVSELEDSADDDDPVDFEKEIAPWLGEKAGISFESYDGEDFNQFGIAVQTTDSDAAQAFVEKQAEDEDEGGTESSYHGVNYWVETDDEEVAGVVDGLLVLAEDEPTFKNLVDASSEESLADSDAFATAMDAAPSGSFADVFVDVGALIEQSGGAIDPEAEQFLDSAGIDPSEATAIASLVPGSDQIEIDLSADLTDQDTSTGDASELLGSLPADSVVAFASAEFGKRFGEAIDAIDDNGIEGEVPPDKLKSTLKEAGIDLDAIAGSIGDIGVFAQGTDKSDLGGAAVLSAENSKEATNTVSNIGLFLRASGTPGITAISGEASGFSVRSADLGSKPLVVAAKGDRIAIAYGPAAARTALAADSDQTLSDDPAYKEAVSSLGSTPISGFAAGPELVNLIASAIAGSDDEPGFLEAKPYLDKIDYVALGSTSSGELATAKLLVGVGK